MNNVRCVMCNATDMEGLDGYSEVFAGHGMLCANCARDEMAELGKVVAGAMANVFVRDQPCNVQWDPADFFSMTEQIIQDFAAGYWRALFRKVYVSHYRQVQRLEAQKEKFSLPQANLEDHNPSAERSKVNNGLRYDVMKKDGFHCQLCGATGKVAQLVVDHIVPVSKGGKTEMENLQTLCFECNSGKGDKV